MSYDYYEGCQIKVGTGTTREFHTYKVGDDVPIPDGVYLAYEGVVVVKDGIFFAQFDSLQHKWGEAIDIKKVLDEYSPVVAALRQVELEKEV